MRHKLSPNDAVLLFYNSLIHLLVPNNSVDFDWAWYWKFREKICGKDNVCRSVIFFEYGLHLTLEVQICFYVQFFLKRTIFSKTVDKECLCAFAKLRRATEIFFMSACPSARNKLLPNRRIFMKFIFLDSSQVCWKNSGFIKIWWQKLLLYMRVTICSWILLRMRNASDESCRGN
jgi:hypothetical protein